MDGGNPRSTTLESLSSSEGFARLEVLINFLRKKGVVQFSSGDLTLSILPDLPAVEDALSPDKPAPVAEKSIRGKDGLTPDEQSELYGRVLDAKG